MQTVDDARRRHEQVWAGKDVMDQSVTLKINGQDVTAPAGSTVLAAAELAGIEIPHLCQHEKLLPAGLCRLCLVEIEKMRGLQPACATVVREGMVVYTDTPAAIHNRRMVLELLCTNHPLDCPVCDAAGDCRLQDYVFRYGRGESRFVEEKRHKGKAIRLGPAVMLDQERCVLCQRCVRFCEEVLDDRQLGVFQRGAQSRISTFPGREFDSIFSGNVADLCPVGAMTSRTARFQGRNWEYQSAPSTCALCPIGCALTADVREGRLKRLRGREAPAVNDGWLCDLGRTGHGFTDHPDRLRQPLLRRAGKFEPTTWAEALEAAASGLKRAVQAGGPQAVAALGSGRLTNEAAYLLGKLARAALGSHNVDSRLGSAVPAPAQASFADLRRADLIVLFLGDPSAEAPILELWIKEAVRRGGKLVIVHPRGLSLERYAAMVLQPRPGSETAFLAGVLAAVNPASSLPLTPPAGGTVGGAGLAGLEPQAVDELAKALLGAQRAVLAYGAGVRDEATVAWLAALARATGAKLLGWSRSPNARGVADVGLRPDRLPGHAPLDDAEARERCRAAWGVEPPAPTAAPHHPHDGGDEKGVRAWLLAASDPVGEGPDPRGAAQALEAADFVVAIESFLTPSAELADVVLPAAVWGEEEGSFTNLAGFVGWQRAVMAPLSEARPAWQILAALAQLLGGPAVGQWQYASASEVLAEIARVAPAYAGAAVVQQGVSFDARFDYATGDLAAPGERQLVGSGELTLLTGAVLFDRGILTGHAEAVAERAPAPFVTLNPADAARLGIVAGALVEVCGVGGALRRRAQISADCPAGCVFVPERLDTENVNLLGSRPGVVAMVDVKLAG